MQQMGIPFVSARSRCWCGRGLLPVWRQWRPHAGTCRRTDEPSARPLMSCCCVLLPPRSVRANEACTSRATVPCLFSAAACGLGCEARQKVSLAALLACRFRGHGKPASSRVLGAQRRRTAFIQRAISSWPLPAAHACSSNRLAPLLPALRMQRCRPAPPLPALLPPQGFDTSQGKKHADVGAVKVKSTRGGRQFMNRRVSAAAGCWTAATPRPGCRTRGLPGCPGCCSAPNLLAPLAAACRAFLLGCL